MTPRNHSSLRRQLMCIIVLKIAVLSGLWWLFIRGHKVPHDTLHTAAHLFGI